MARRTLAVGILLLQFIAPTVFAHGAGDAPVAPSAERLFQYYDRNDDERLNPEELRRLPVPLRRALVKEAADGEQAEIDRTTFIKRLPAILESLRRTLAGSPKRAAQAAAAVTASPAAAVGSVSTTAGTVSSGTAALEPPGRPVPAGSSTAVASGPAAPSPPSALTLRLPESFRQWDRDGDGQIGLYEWDRRSLHAFRQADLNGDGFLTPGELAVAGTSVEAAQPSDSASSRAPTPPVAANPSQPTSSSSRSTTVSPPTNPPAVSLDEIDPRLVRAAEYVFSRLDRDRDGQLTEQEWARSQRTRRDFERRGIQLPLPADARQFTLYFAQMQSTRPSR